MNKNNLKYFCIDCGEKIHYQTALYGQKRCLSCASKGENNPSFGKHYYKYNITKKVLIQEYIKNKKSPRQIAKKLNCSITPIIRLLKKYKIKIRTASEAIKGISKCKGKDNYFYGKHLFGSSNGNWKNGISILNNCIRTNDFYKKWRNKVFKRDNYTCQECGQIGGDLEAHHKKAFIKILKENKINTIKKALKCKKLWNVNNGITFCIKCHSKIDKYRRI